MTAARWFAALVITHLIFGTATVSLSAKSAPPAMNSLLVIAPYKHSGLWVFDDPAVGLRQEPFVSGADHIMDLLSAQIPQAESGFTLVFSAQPFPGYQAHFVRDRAEHGGTWYRWPKQKVEGWLCPALFKYFPAAPPDIYVQARPRAPKPVSKH